MGKMRAAMAAGIAGLGLLMAAGAAWAREAPQWHVFSADKNTLAVVSEISGDGRINTGWVTVIYREPQMAGDAKVAIMGIHYEMDCKAGRMRSTGGRVYDESATPIGPDFNDVDEWETVSPDTNAALAAKAICHPETLGSDTLLTGELLDLRQRYLRAVAQ